MKKHIIIALLLIGVLVPLTTRAQTQATNQLLAQIADLQRQLVILQGQQNPAGVWCHTFNANLSIGTRGGEVTALQTALNRAGFPVNQSENGVFGEHTASAVSSFQLAHKNEILTANGLTYPTGYFGSATRRKMNSLSGCGNTIIPPALPPVIIPNTTAREYSLLINNPRIQKAIRTNILVARHTDGYVEILVKKINEIESGNTTSWNNYRDSCPHSLNNSEREKCLRDIYLRKVALSLYVEANKLVPWKLLDYNDKELATLLGDLYVQNDQLRGDYYISRNQAIYNGNPMLAFNYIKEAKRLYPQKTIASQKDLLSLIIYRMRADGWKHATGGDQTCVDQNYDFECVIKWKNGSSIITPGVIYALLQSYNVPSVEEGKYLEAHTGIIFPSLNLGMEGNDVYADFKDGLFKKNSLPIDLTFRDLDLYNKWNILPRCQAGHEEARKTVLDYLSLYDKPQWNEDIKVYYCLNVANGGQKPGEQMRIGITKNLIQGDCNPEENPNAIGRMEPPLTQQELDVWMEKISQVAQCTR